MSKKIAGLIVTLCLASGLAQADDQVTSQTQVRQQQTAGRQLMSEEERNQQRDKMRSAASREEQEQVRAEHHEKMKERAKEQGVSLPENPPPRGAGMKGSGAGRGGR